jgi:hypothetical protein
VRRREPDEGAPGGVPSRLRRFDPDQWPGADIWERYAAWHEATRAFAEQRGGWWDESLTELLEAQKLVPDEPWDQDKV